MILRVFDFTCAACEESFEALVRGQRDMPQCPKCGSAKVTRQPVLRISIRASKVGRVVDLSSKSCPCAYGGPKHAHR
ncbi:MAG: zinc ribbon domain-containing protein [Alphaproteobacteria bacterium]|nr:zinc ribbon domain-containing protein [Alphaproteobacteria bacterium]